MKGSKIFIETPRLILRQWEDTDKEVYIGLNRDSEVMEFFPSLLSPLETTSQIERLRKHIDEYGNGFSPLKGKITMNL